jgi:tetratricopeptide (TPR) repeat protein
LASIREGRVAFDAADYPTAARWLDEAVHTKSDSETTTQSLLHLARARTRMGAFPAAQSAVTQVSRARAQDDSNLDVLWHFVQGEMAYETNRAAEALTHFEEAGRAWTDSTPDSASVEGHAYAGLLRVLAGQADGRHAVEACRSYGSTTGRFVLYGRCSVLLARIDVEAHQFRSALATLDAVPADDDTRALGDELQAQRHYWRGRALAGIGRAAQAGDEERLARALLQHVRAVIPMEMQSSFDSRPDIRRILK